MFPREEAFYFRVVSVYRAGIFPGKRKIVNNEERSCTWMIFFNTFLAVNSKMPMRQLRRNA
jgi:hypothetical protein